MSTMRVPTSEELYRRALAVMPGGVNSPVRAFKAVGGLPPFMAYARGSRLYDQEGRSYLDFIGSWGPMILGHQHPAIVKAVSRQAEIAMSFGAPTELEVQLAELVVEMVPAVEMVRMVNSGTEACMSVIRLARAATGRELIIKFVGCYHGHADPFLAKAGSGMATLGEPTSPGVPAGSAAATLNATFNDLASVEALMKTHGENVAAVMLEPVVGNMGCVGPEPGFLEGLKTICASYGALLIFDEVMTGFRLAPGGAMERFGVTPDLVCLGKVLGGGLPVGAYGGRRELMEKVSPAGPMYQAGTLSGNPLGMAAGLAQLGFLREHPDVYTKLEQDGRLIEEAVTARLEERGYPASFNRVGSMGTVFFTPEKVRCWQQAAACDTTRHARYFHHLLESGVYMPPAQFEAYFHSYAHADDEIERTAELMGEAIDAAFAD